MKRQKIRRLYLWGPWSFKKTELWLEKKEESGWYLLKVGLLQIYFVFERKSDEALSIIQHVSYSIDYNPGIQEQYVLLCKDDGWELKSLFFGWYIWRKESDSKTSKLYTSYNSIIERQRRIFLFLIFILALQVLPIQLFMRHSMPIILLGIYMLLLIIIIYSISRLILSNYLLKKEINR